MLNNQIKILSNLSNIAFKQSPNQTTAIGQPLKMPEKDSFVANNEIEPPKIETWKFLLRIFRTITDEDIAQINKAKMLPENLRFIYMDPDIIRGSLATQPYYMIVPHSSLFPDQGTRILPKDYEVKRDILGEIRAVKIKKS